MKKRRKQRGGSWDWVKQVYRLSDAQVRLGKEAGLDPSTIGDFAGRGQARRVGLVPRDFSASRRRQRTQPLGEFIERYHQKNQRRKERERVQAETEIKATSGDRVATPPKAMAMGPKPDGKRQLASPDKWLKQAKRFGLSPKHLHMAKALSLSPNNFRKLADRARTKSSLTLREFIEKTYKGSTGKDSPEVREPFLTTLWREGSSRSKRIIERRYPAAVPDLALEPKSEKTRELDSTRSGGRALPD